ncbi:GNAT family N-acetyltransferase [Pseudonocardia sp. TRM90224]|uniref:GNAT family N-acetyltransferase n=1 Tax=Pseudonocardia sp. TRM90224 TaxID=2812678 RepID=UPI0035A8FB93
MLHPDVVAALPVVRIGCAADEDGLASVIPDPGRRAWRIRNAESGTEQLLVAEEGSRIVGAVSIRWNGECDPPNPWIYGGEVEEAWRGQGVGSLLWREAHRACSARGALAVSLDVDSTNARARRLYERLGYEVVGPHAHQWVARDPETGAVAAEGVAETWLMRCRLPVVGPASPAP